jgi:hypothetical protein
MVGKTIEREREREREAYELASKRDVTMSFALSSIFYGRILSAEEDEKVVMFLLIERKWISLGNGLQSTSPWLPSALLFYFFLY